MMMLPNSRRAYTRTACVSCRRSKIKCDGRAPACSNCKTKSRECRYEEIDDKRRLSLRGAMELLCSRIDQLCSFIDDNGLRLPPMDRKDHMALLKVFRHQRIPYDTLSKDLRPIHPPSEDAPPLTSRGQPNPHNHEGREKHQKDTQTGLGPLTSAPPSEDEVDVPGHASVFDQSGATKEIIQSGPSMDDWIDTSTGLEPLEALPESTWSHTGQDGSGSDHVLSFGVTEFDNASLQSSQPANRQPEQTEGDDTGSETTEDLVNLLSERIGSLHVGPGGHIRYLGPTSNFSLAKMPFPDLLAVNRTTRDDGKDHLDRLGLGKAVEPSLEEHLTNLYFVWQDPSMHVVNRRMYESAKSRWRNGEESPYYSESLQNAICALGAAFESRHHPTLVTFPRSLADFFADRAKSLLEIELDLPCVATVQAMAVLSSHEIGCKRDSRGWLYCGMVMRLALDLGLHMDMTIHVAQGILTQEEADVRGEVFWGAYIVDHNWGFYLGKPARPHTDDITVSKPRADPELDMLTQWSPYPAIVGQQATISLPDQLHGIHRQRVMMAEIMAPVANAVYGNYNIPCKTLQEMNVETVAKLLNWKATLPPSLQIDENDKQTRHLPHVLLLHMQYHQNIIHAHRPYMSKTYHQPFPPQGPGSGHARMMCMNSAFSIAGLLKLYETSYELRKINVQAVGIACSAALLLIFANITRTRPDGGRIERDLNTCFRALDEFSLSWHNAKTSRELLLLLQRQWQLKCRSTRPQPVRRASVALSLGSDEASRKRYRALQDAPAADALDPAMYLFGPGSGPSPDQQGLDINMGLDLDWMVAGFPFAMSQFQGGRL